MPVLYADEDEAKAIMGDRSWHAPYAESMAPARRWRHGRHRGSRVQHRLPGQLASWGYTPPTPQVGALYQAGLGDAEFDRWSSILDQYTDLIPYINNGAARESLAHKANALYPSQQALIKAFAGTPGTLDAARALVFGKQVKSFRDAVNKARDQYGVGTTKNPVYLLKSGGGKGKGKAGKVNWLLWGSLAAAGVAAAKFFKVF